LGQSVFFTRNSFTANQWYRWKSETLKVCLLLVWRVCDQALIWICFIYCLFSFYYISLVVFVYCLVNKVGHLANIGLWRVPKSGHVTTKIENLHIDTCRKFHRFQKNAILFNLQRKITKLSRKIPFQNSGVATRL